MLLATPTWFNFICQQASSNSDLLIWCNLYLSVWCDDSDGDHWSDGGSIDDDAADDDDSIDDDDNCWMTIYITS